MVRFVGINNNRISIVSDKPFQSDKLKIVELPVEFDNIDASDILVNYKFSSDRVVHKRPKLAAKDMRIAFIANYGSKCGIGTYSKFLLDELIDLVGDYKIFSEITNDNTIENIKIPQDKILPCWKRGESLAELIKAIKLYDPTTIIIQHEFGLFPNARFFIAMMNQLNNFKTLVVMHSVFKHNDKTIVEAAMPQIIVHLDGAKEVLREKGISAPINVISHGCFPCIDETKLWNFYKSNQTFCQFGFLFAYKGFENSIRATAILKEKYQDVFFTAICSESPHAMVEHEIYYNKLMDLISDLGLQENVGIVRGFQGEHVIDSYLRTNKAAVFPYVSNKSHECWGSSGAAPYTMTKNIPVITSSIHHFCNLPSIKADTPEEIASALDNLFTDQEFVKTQLKKQKEYLLENTWKITAQRYLDVIY